MGLQLEETSVEQWPAYRLANKALRLVVIPALGGKMVSLQSLRTGREWLWKNPSLALRQPPPGASDFGQFDAGGWDEVFPTVTPCQLTKTGWGERRLRDHGELLYRSWSVVECQQDSDLAVSLTSAMDSPELPFRFERKLTLATGDGPLTIHYKVQNLFGDESALSLGGPPADRG